MAYGNNYSGNNYGNNNYGNNRQGGGFDRRNSQAGGYRQQGSNQGGGYSKPYNKSGYGGGSYNGGGYKQNYRKNDQPYVLEPGKGKAFPRERTQGEKVGRPTHTGNINLKEDKFILDLISENGGVLPISIWVNEQTGVISISVQTTQEKIEAIQQWEEANNLESQERKSIGGNTADNRSFQLIADLQSTLNQPQKPSNRNSPPPPPNARNESVEDPPFEPTEDLPKKVPARGKK